MKVPPVPADEEERLRVLRSFGILDAPPEPAYDDLARLAAYICGTPMGIVHLIDERRQWRLAKVGVEESETPREVSFCAHAILDPQRLLVVEDARKDERFYDNPFVTAAPPLVFYAGAPLVSAEGAAIGTLCVADHVPHRLTPEQEEALSALARQAMAHLELRRHVDRLADAVASLHRAPGGEGSQTLLRTLLSDLLAHGGLAPPALSKVGEKLAAGTGDGLEDGLEAYRRMGFGRLRLVEKDASGRYVFSGQDLVERTARGRACTCHLALGFARGLVARERKAPSAPGAEVACQSRGDAECRFVVQARS